MKTIGTPMKHKGAHMKNNGKNKGTHIKTLENIGTTKGKQRKTEGINSGQIV